MAEQGVSVFFRLRLRRHQALVATPPHPMSRSLAFRTLERRSAASSGRSGAVRRPIPASSHAAFREAQAGGVAAKKETQRRSQLERMTGAPGGSARFASAGAAGARTPAPSFSAEQSAPRPVHCCRTRDWRLQAAPPRRLCSLCTLSTASACCREGPCYTGQTRSKRLPLEAPRSKGAEASAAAGRTEGSVRSRCRAAAPAAGGTRQGAAAASHAHTVATHRAGAKFALLRAHLLQ